MRLLVMSVVVLVAACSRPPEPPSEKDKALLRTIEEPQQRAKAVEVDVLQASKKTDATLDQAENTPPPQQ